MLSGGQGLLRDERVLRPRHAAVRPGEWDVPAEDRFLPWCYRRHLSARIYLLPFAFRRHVLPAQH